MKQRRLRWNRITEESGIEFYKWYRKEIESGIDSGRIEDGVEFQMKFE